jgi:hypothetical protein
MEVLDQQVATARPVAEQRLHLLQGRDVDLAPLGARRAEPLTLARVTVLADLARGLAHEQLSGLAFLLAAAREPGSCAGPRGPPRSAEPAQPHPRP